MKYKAVIFDLDGTLLNTLEDLTDAVNAAMKRNSLPVRTLEEVRRFVGNGIVKLVERAVPEGKKNPVFDKALQDFKSYYQAHCWNKTAPYPGVMDMLVELAEKKVGTAIVSNKADAAVQKLKTYYFDEVIAVVRRENEKKGIPKKPAPEMVFGALRELGVSPEEAIYVGDSDVDIKTAENAGMPCLSVCWGFRDENFLKKHGADRLIYKPEEILKFFR